MIEAMHHDRCPHGTITHAEAMMFLFAVGDGWRLPTIYELRDLAFGVSRTPYIYTWSTTSDQHLPHFLRPVRNRND